MSEPTPPAPGAAPRLTPGMRLGPYEILAALGAGGMGEVFRARDSRLGREVAVKVLPAAVAGDPERLRRFEQEARTAGQLDHPNLLTVFDVGTHDGVAYLVTELLRGETLRARLAAGPLPRAEAVSLAAEYARGLAAAHARGVVHRDLKPENLFVTRDGHARILDFGLARIVREPAAGTADADGRTDTALTSPGMILGTAGYMSPEQVRGELADARSDLFCLGAVIYEMLTGTRAFAGGTAAETMGAILHQEPRPGLAPFTDEHDPLWRVVRRCLEKDRDRRFESAGDLAFALEMAAGRSAAGPSAREPGRPAPAWPAPLAVAAGLVAVAAVAWAAFALRAPRATPSLMAAATLTPLTVDPGDEENPSFAPDGETIAYASDRSGNYEVYLQQVAGGPAVNLTQDGADDTQPAFSPDGRTIAFVSTRRRGVRLYIPAPGVPLVGGDLWTMPALGGTPRRIADNAYLPSWSPDGRYLYFSSGPWYRSTIQRVPVGGGAAETVAVRLPKGATAPYLLSAHVSPDGRWLLFWARDVVYVMPLAGGEARRLAYGRYPTFMDGGRGVLYCNALPGRNHSLWRLDFDPARGASFGSAMPLTAGTVEAAAPAVSPRGGQIAFTAVDRQLNLEALPFDADGAGVRGSPIAVTTGNHRVRFFSISPDGRDIVYEDERGAESHLWRQSVAGGEAVQLTLEPGYAEAFPRWSPDGRMIEFTRGPAGQPEETGGPWLMSADGGNPHAAGVPLGRRGAWLPGSEGLLFELRSGRFARFDIASGRTTEVDSSLRAVPIFCLSNDSRWIAYQYAASGSVDVLAVPLDASAPPRVVVQTPADDGHSFFSPNGRWLYWQPNHLNLYRVPGPAQGWREAPAQQMTHFPERGLYLEEPQISFDGRTLAYVRASVRGDLWLLRLGGADSVAAAAERR